MYKLYNIVKYKTDIKGFWLDDNKVYIDNIQIKKCKILTKKIRDKLFKNFMQLAIFYIKDNIGYIEDLKGNITILKHNIQYKEKHINKSYIKALLLQHGGLTVFKNKTGYTISIWR